jgi:hypothetical protein
MSRSPSPLKSAGIKFLALPGTERKCFLRENSSPEHHDRAGKVKRKRKVKQEEKQEKLFRMGLTLRGLLGR